MILHWSGILVELRERKGDLWTSWQASVAGISSAGRQSGRWDRLKPVFWTSWLEEQH